MLQNIVLRTLGYLDGWMNRLYGWKHNPLYHSGALVVVLFLVILATGLYLIFFYRIGSPYESVARLDQQVWLGSWIRSLHRYASDAAIVAAAVHVFRVFAQRRTWGPRALAWVSGVVLLFFTFVCGWTGYVMVWDVQAVELAREGARFLDALPLFSEPISRSFVGEQDVPRAFFFMNLFLHVALPVGLGVLMWIHVARVARPALLPPRGLTWGVVALLLVMSIAWPAPLGAAADLLRLPDPAPYDLFYVFWLPITRELSPAIVWAISVGGGTVVTVIPWLTRPAPAAHNVLQPSWVDQKLCDACEQCYLDCPYEAISMVPRSDSRYGTVAAVDPALCVSCGICAGSCAPMGVGPPGRSGRDQLARVTTFIGDQAISGRDVVLVACDRGAGGMTFGAVDAPVFAVDCAGSMHTSVLEYLVRSGVGGVLVVSCPPRDCWSREGPKWLEERLYHEREAELKARVDRRRIRLVYAGLGDGGLVARELARFRHDLETVDDAEREERIRLDTGCQSNADVEGVA